VGGLESHTGTSITCTSHTHTHTHTHTKRCAGRLMLSFQSNLRSNPSVKAACLYADGDDLKSICIVFWRITCLIVSNTDVCTSRLAILMHKIHTKSRTSLKLAVFIYTLKMLGWFNPNLGQIWTNPAFRFNFLITFLTQSFGLSIFDPKLC